MKDGPFKRAYLQIGGTAGWAPFEKVWELLKHTLYAPRGRRGTFSFSLSDGAYAFFITLASWPRFARVPRASV